MAHNVMSFRKVVINTQISKIADFSMFSGLPSSVFTKISQKTGHFIVTYSFFSILQWVTADDRVAQLTASLHPGCKIRVFGEMERE